MIECFEHTIETFVEVFVVDTRSQEVKMVLNRVRLDVLECRFSFLAFLY